jgi:hypothetical protein
MKLLLLAVATTLICLMSFAQKNNSLSTIEKKEGWKLLFDGKTMMGWHSYNKAAAGEAWKVKDGVLFLDTTKKEGWQVASGGDLVNENIIANFDLKMDWKISKAGNSGIIFYVQEEKKYENSWLTGLEMQVLDNDGHNDGKITKHRAGDLYDLIKCSKETVKPVGEWNQAEIISDNGSLTLLLNGVKVVSTTLWDDHWKQLVAGSKFKDMPDFGKFRSGKIALQDHGNEVSFRNIKIKEL